MCLLKAHEVHSHFLELKITGNSLALTNIFGYALHKSRKLPLFLAQVKDNLKKKDWGKQIECNFIF